MSSVDKASKQERRMNFSYDFEGQPTDFQGDSFCDDTDGNWDSVDYGEKLLFCFFDFEEFIGTSI